MDSSSVGGKWRLASVEILLKNGAQLAMSMFGKFVCLTVYGPPQQPRAAHCKFLPFQLIAAHRALCSLVYCCSL